ncbi:DUF3783 domain-containing protein [Porcipelethomonas sp.]|uniref:DUF3783 domain-containing protein n=1 Tax=Porcipelethomonas sp. TaxID=2981675 RepID=UPI003EF1E238
MKSRIRISANRLIIGYMIQECNLEGLKTTADILDAELKLCGKECSGEKVGFLAKFNGFKESNITVPEPPEDECLILSGFNSKDMDKLLAALKKNNVNIPLKCIVTQHNQSWELYKLIEELKKEHRQMNK